MEYKIEYDQKQNESEFLILPNFYRMWIKKIW